MQVDKTEKVSSRRGLSSSSMSTHVRSILKVVRSETRRFVLRPTRCQIGLS